MRAFAFGFVAGSIVGAAGVTLWALYVAANVEDPASGVPADSDGRVPSPSRAIHPASGVVVTPDAAPVRPSIVTMPDPYPYCATCGMREGHWKGCHSHPTHLAVADPDSSHPGVGGGGDLGGAA